MFNKTNLKDYDTVVKALTNMSAKKRLKWMNKAYAIMMSGTTAFMSEDEQLVIQHIFNAGVTEFNKDGSKKQEQPKDEIEVWVDEQLGSINRELLNQLL